MRLTDHSDCAFNIDGYKTFSLHRSDRPGGGMKLYYSDEIEASILPDFTSKNGPYEKLFIRV